MSTFSHSRTCLLPPAAFLQAGHLHLGGKSEAENEAEVLPQRLRGEDSSQGQESTARGAARARPAAGAGSRNQNKGRRQKNVMVVQQR